jgi:translation initiation factor IF-3
MTNYRRRRKFKKNLSPRYYINHQIRDPEVRVITDDGENLGVLSIQDAILAAEERGKDLLKINPKANPPICKILDWSKFKYLQSKSENKKAKEKKLKTIRVSVRIGPHDLEVQAKKCDQFLEKGHQVKLQVQMKGREKAHPEVAAEVMEDLLKIITFPHDTLSEVKRTGDSYYATLQPTAKPTASNSSKVGEDDDYDEDDYDEDTDDMIDMEENTEE